MFVDNELTLSNGQAITASAVSTYSVNLGTVRDIGKGKQLYAVIVVDVSAVSGDVSKTLAISLITDNAADLSSPTTILTLPNITGANLTAGRTPIVIAIPPGIAQQYLGLYYYAATSFASGLRVTAFVAFEYQSNL